MTLQELKMIFDKIVTQTGKGVLKWSPVKGNVMRVDFARSSIELKRDWDFAENEYSYSLNIYNSAGFPIAKIDAQTFSSEQTSVELDRLYNRAYDNAFQVTETLRDVLKGLEDK